MNTQKISPYNQNGLHITVFVFFSFFVCCDAEENNDPSLVNPDYPYNGGAVSGSGGTIASSGSGGTNIQTPSNGGVAGTDTAGNSGTDSGVFLVPSGMCEGQEFIPNKQVDIMLLQDMSLSLSVDLEGRSKWEHAKEAITSILTDPKFQGMGLRFGFDYFPDTSVNTNATTGRKVNGCGVDDPVVVDVGVNTQSQIVDWMNAHMPDGLTPLHCALNKFTDPNYAPNFINANTDRYLIVISDGADACGIDCASNNDEQLFAKPDQLAQVAGQLLGMGIRTIVIGFGNAVAPDQLNAISQAGGVFSEYLDAYSADELRLAFETIFCNF